MARYSDIFCAGSSKLSKLCYCCQLTLWCYGDLVCCDVMVMCWFVFKWWYSWRLWRILINRLLILLDMKILNWILWRVVAAILRWVIVANYLRFNILNYCYFKVVLDISLLKVFNTKLHCSLYYLIELNYFLSLTLLSADWIVGAVRNFKVIIYGLRTTRKFSWFCVN